MSNDEERKVFESWFISEGLILTDINPYALVAWDAFQAGAAYQRTQAQPADAYRMARALSDRYADQCRLDKDDYWKLYGQDCIDDVRAMLEGAKHE